MKTQMKKLLSLSLALLMGVGFAFLPSGGNVEAAAYGGGWWMNQLDARDQYMQVQAQGMVSVEPDICVISLGVRSQEKTAKEASDSVNLKMADIFKALEAAGIEKKDYRTDNFYIRTNFNWQSDPPTIVGYEASNSITVKVRELDKVGEILAAALDAGANEVQDVRYDLEDKREAYREALKKAVKSAMDKAGVLAEAAHIKIEAIPTEISEESVMNFGNVFGMGDIGGMGAAEGSPATAVSLSVSSVDIKAVVNASFAIQDSPVAEEAKTDKSLSPRIEVQSRGLFESVPDIVTLSVGVRARGDTAKGASDEVNQKMEAILSELDKAGVDKKDYRTINFNISPQYNYNGDEPQLYAFEASNNLVVKVRDVEKVGEVLATLLDAGANEVQDVSYKLEDPSEAYTKALSMAVKNAGEKAAAIAEAAGLKLVETPLYINESSDSYSPVVNEAKMMSAETEMAVDSAAHVALSGSTITVAANVDSAYTFTE